MQENRVEKKAASSSGPGNEQGSGDGETIAAYEGFLYAGDRDVGRSNFRFSAVNRKELRSTLSHDGSYRTCRTHLYPTCRSSFRSQ